MSGIANDDCKASGTKAIPTRRVVVNDPTQMPSDYSTTPGGTLFSTTPGGINIFQIDAVANYLTDNFWLTQKLFGMLWN